MTFIKFKRFPWSVFLLSLVYVLLSGCGVTQKTTTVLQPKNDEQKIDTLTIKEPVPSQPFTVKEVPETPREFREVWVATVSNIDWPSQPDLPVAEQKAELKAIMERAAELHLNAVMLQIRPAADALYDSSYEPWSYFLTGKQGKAPQPYYDPLKFAIQQAHKYGLELHVWFNPFRAYHPSAEFYFAPDHIQNTHPEWLVKYGDYYWLNPGFKEARQYTIKVIMDVVRRYDIDGVHLDDYFYPYPRFYEDGGVMPYNDDVAYQNYLETHPPINRDDWRRHNVNTFVKKLSAAIEKADSTLLFGISPFGIWRPNHPPQIVGLDAYDLLFADSRKWLRKGWVDYLAPQLYWAIDNEGQRFPVLLQWWNQQNINNRFIWPGLYTSNIRNYPEYGFPSSEIINQIVMIRNRQEVSGHIHFSMQALMKNYGNISDKLLSGPYKVEALVPAVTWTSIPKPPKPQARLKAVDNKYLINLSSKKIDEPWLWVVKTKYGNGWKIDIYSGRKEKIWLPQEIKKGSFIGAAVSAVNEQSAESKPILLFPKNKLQNTFTLKQF